jgi:hypothetical protein
VAETFSKINSSFSSLLKVVGTISFVGKSEDAGVLPVEAVVGVLPFLYRLYK